MPKGFDAESPYANDLKRKDFICSVAFSEKDVGSGVFMKKFVSACQEMNPLMEFLTEALGLPW